MTKIVSYDDNKSMNLYVANVTLILAFLFVCAFIFNEFGVYYANRDFMKISLIGSLICIGIVQIIGRIPKIASSGATKYAIVYLMSMMTLIVMSLLNFHAVLLLSVPMVIALNYHSGKLSVWTLVCTLTCAVVAPLLGCYLKTWDVSYFVFLTYCVAPELIVGTPYADYLRMGEESLKGGTFATMINVVKNVSLPQAFFALFMGVFIILTNYRKRKGYRAQISNLNRSQNKILMGMSDIVEGRDGSTGGHIKRTSKVVGFLVDALVKDKSYEGTLKNSFCECVVKAAPMHDLGKIAIADSILNKPGKLTDDEFMVIKDHPQKSHDIIKNVLDGLNDEVLMDVAENIALYHHEKYDGTGYPMGLKGDEIPLEAKIMAIADVYDALVSERCYKQPISHEEAYKIIEDSMGTHFDPKLRHCFEIAYPSLVKFYGESA